MAVIEAIATQYLEANASSVTFTSIPGTYEHLELRVSIHGDYANNYDYTQIDLNSDTTAANYTQHEMYGNATTESAQAINGWKAYINWAASGASGTKAAVPALYGVGIVTILDYTNTNKNTTLIYEGGVTGYNMAGSFQPGVAFGSSMWIDTDAVTAITLSPGNGTNFIRGSSFSLYGIQE
jgi:hypothetical protein